MIPRAVLKLRHYLLSILTLYSQKVPLPSPIAVFLPRALDFAAPIVFTIWAQDRFALFAICNTIPANATSVPIFLFHLRHSLGRFLYHSNPNSQCVQDYFQTILIKILEHILTVWIFRAKALFCYYEFRVRAISSSKTCLSLTCGGISLIETNVQAKPFLKWAGGKSQLLDQLAPLFPKHFERYHEPFLGGGAVFFTLASDLKPANVFLSDVNRDLIEAYQVVRDNVDELIEHLKVHVNEKEYYYRLRALNIEGMTPIERVSRFIYLNKTCYNGLYRVNRAGQFNVPFGRYKNPNIVNAEGLRAASEALQGISIEVRSFESCVDYVKAGDFVYFDPPYHPLSSTARFTSYTGNNFGPKDQENLRDVFVELHRKGCYVMQSNSDTEFIRNLYRDFEIDVVSAKRFINSASDKRGAIHEVVIRNYRNEE
jgi:DNA adenine methylase